MQPDSPAAEYATDKGRDDGGRVMSHEDDDTRSSTDSVETQTGVKKVEAVSMTWSKWGLIIAYVGYARCCSYLSLEEPGSSISIFHLIGAIGFLQWIISCKPFHLT